jgi:hypothetical protein
MKKKLFFTSVLLMQLFVTRSQESKKPVFRSINLAGVVTGASGDAFQLQTINGVYYKTFSAGIGVGIDNYNGIDMQDYKLKTIPLFADLRKNLLRRKSTPFVYLDLGWNLPWERNVSLDDWSRAHYRAGLYYDAGLGYSLHVRGRFSLLLSAGYSQKEQHATLYYRYSVWDIMPSPTSSETQQHYDYTFRRFSLKAGISF